MNKKVAVYTSFIVLLLILTCISLFFVVYFYKFQKQNYIVKNLLVNESSLINYKINTKKNTGSNNINKNNVNSIDGLFNYTVSFDKEVKGNYTYSIVGYLDDSKETQVFKTDEVNNKVEGNVINLSSSFQIDYKSIVDKYHADNVIYDVVINYVVYNNGLKKYISNNKTLELKISLNSSVVKVKTSKNEKNQRIEVTKENAKNDIYYIICLEFIGASVLFLLCILLLMNKLNNLETKYEKFIRKTLNKYDQYIVQVVHIPDLSNKSMIFVKTFADILDAADNLGTPINYAEIIKKRESVFIVFNHEYAYVYKVSANKLK